ncbi:unnamed protein product [Lepidochelys kempii]
MRGRCAVSLGKVLKGGHGRKGSTEAARDLREQTLAACYRVPGLESEQKENLTFSTGHQKKWCRNTRAQGAGEDIRSQASREVCLHTRTGQPCRARERVKSLWRSKPRYCCIRLAAITQEGDSSIPECFVLDCLGETGKWGVIYFMKYILEKKARDASKE